MTTETHRHVWEQATPSDLAGYLSFEGLPGLPEGVVRLLKCDACSEHRVVALDPDTGEETLHNPHYGS